MELLNNPVLAKQIGNRAQQEAVERYDLSRMAGDYDKDYRELVRNSQNLKETPIAAAAVGA